MFDWFENAPEWCTVVVDWSDLGWAMFLETDERGVSGRLVKWNYDMLGSGLETMGDVPENHAWWESKNQSQVVARRNSKNAPKTPRYLTEEEIVLLHDLGLLEEALEQQGVEMQPRVESYLTVKVENSLTGDIEYLFDEEFNENDSAATVEDFFDVVETAYHKLGFENHITVTADCGNHGFTKVFQHDF